MKPVKIAILALALCLTIVASGWCEPSINWISLKEAQSSLKNSRKTADESAKGGDESSEAVDENAKDESEIAKVEDNDAKDEEVSSEEVVASAKGGDESSKAADENAKDENEIAKVEDNDAKDEEVSSEEVDESAKGDDESSEAVGKNAKDENEIAKVEGADAKDKDVSSEEADESGEVADDGDKIVYLYFYTDWCTYCKQMESNTFKNPEVIKYLNDNFLPVRLNPEKSAEARKTALNFYVRSFPSSAFSTDGVAPIDTKHGLTVVPGAMPPEMFLTILEYLKTRSYEKMALHEFVNSKNK
ncbi:hypothetical protein Dalk_3464 [Desulfatibacillum aliphaticivorans]|uniref:Thioredoxin domain-containing protein n=1 Tax=Desulfatibacillum aliphaticivorans TaxID=218208 RepID=B8FBU7_DESAL|nr:thioredoxin family protein [Desulfatibacillum aliphaticivorans]ACL05152.1 hypothetical protein Dalk_3464 [Desulfatibacillum aliphaticivorans]